MATKLKEYFQTIREREEVLAEIAKDSALQTKFDGWESEQQEEFPADYGYRGGIGRWEYSKC